jgi:hypothetical protein
MPLYAFINISPSEEIFTKAYRALANKPMKEEEKTIKYPLDLFEGLSEVRKTKRVRRSKLQILKDGKAKQRKISANELKRRLSERITPLRSPRSCKCSRIRCLWKKITLKREIQKKVNYQSYFDKIRMT